MRRNLPAQGCRKLEAVVGPTGEGAPRRDDRWTVGAVFGGICVGDGYALLGIRANPLIFHGSAIADGGRIYLQTRIPPKIAPTLQRPWFGQDRVLFGKRVG